jgi:hypothetical protein
MDFSGSADGMVFHGVDCVEVSGSPMVFAAPTPGASTLR